MHHFMFSIVSPFSLESKYTTSFYLIAYFVLLLIYIKYRTELLCSISSCSNLFTKSYLNLWDEVKTELWYKVKSDLASTQNTIQTYIVMISDQSTISSNFIIQMEPYCLWNLDGTWFRYLIVWAHMKRGSKTSYFS